MEIVRPVLSPEETAKEESREKYRRVVSWEKMKTNDIPLTLLDDVVEGYKKMRTALSTEDVIEDQAHRIDDLKKKESSSLLTSEEKQEMELREKTEVFMLKEMRDSSELLNSGSSFADFPPIGLNGTYPSHKIEGLVDGKNVEVFKVAFPDIPEEKKNEVLQKWFGKGFTLAGWEGPVKYGYGGKVGDSLFPNEILPEEEAQKLFEKLASFAEKRTEEIKSLKKEKEIKKYGHEISGGDDEWYKLNEWKGFGRMNEGNFKEKTERDALTAEEVEKKKAEIYKKINDNVDS